ncbi:MAG: beta-ketoacyl-ACP reductase [Lachnospiraceae bacterium]|nr:beta-ketoacyl-ACP reductase [Lachnospiraceae bacterium]MBO4766765.1 beta-ketoacyl-ACP reductase [Lachnospiraceae bacterium]
MILDGKTALITGGTRGIGLAVAKKYAANGAKVAILAAHGGERAEAAVKELLEIRDNNAAIDLPSAGAESHLTEEPAVRFYVCDVSNAEAVAETVAQVLADFGSVDILVNNAGITRDNLLAGMSETEIDDVIDVNLKGTMFMTKALIKHFMKKRRGVIVNLSSVVGMMGNKGQTNYAASKAGVIGFTKSVAKEYGSRNIRCNAIAPGYIATEMTAALTDEMRTELTKQLPIARLGEPEDVANLALFLAGDQSSYITGEVIRVDGGMYV